MIIYEEDEVNNMSHYNEKMKEIDEQIKISIENMNSKGRLNKLINSAKQERLQLRNKVEQLKKQLAKEEADVEKLINISFTNLLHTVLNDKVEKLDKEQREVLEAKLKYETAQTELDECNNQIKKMEKENFSIMNASKEYESLIRQKQELIESFMPEKWDIIENHLEEDKMLSSQEKEIKEAINAGDRVISQLDQAKSALTSARNWGTWDMLGGGTLSTMVKRQKMREAQDYINQTQSVLRVFTRELADVDTYINIDLQLDSFLGFADYFFDGFFIDMAVQSKINSGQEKVNAVYSKVSGIISNLKSQYSIIKNKRDKINKDIKVVVEQA